MTSRAAGTVIAVASIAILSAVTITHDSWETPARVLWTDPLKVSLASGEPREVQFRVSPQHKDWDQWTPSRAGGAMTATEIARAVGKGFNPDDVYVAEILVGSLGCTEVEMATLGPHHQHGKEGSKPHRHRSGWSNRIVLGECLVPAPGVVRASEPSRLALVMSGLPVLMLIAYLKP
jgi:hypothetical protein